MKGRAKVKNRNKRVLQGQSNRGKSRLKGFNISITNYYHVVGVLFTKLVI